MTFESEPLDAQQQSDEPILPEKPRAWSPPFRFLVALVVLIGLVATLYGVAGSPLGNIPYSSLAVERYILTNEQAGFLLTGVFLAVCVAGLWFTRRSGTRLRIGLILRAVALLGAMLLVFPVAVIAFSGVYSAVISFYFSLTFLYTPPFMQLFQLALGILALLSQLCFSYGLARWQPSDRVFIWVQLAVSLGLVGLVIQQDSSYFYPGISWAFVLQIAGGAFLSGATTACFLLRPACWKASPLIVLCFTVGVVLSLIFSEVVERFFYNPGSTTQILQTFYVINLAGSTLLILGALLLIQRTRKQKTVDAPNLAGSGSQMPQPEQDAPNPDADVGQG